MTERVVIVGAGIAGLTLAERLVRKSELSVILLERENIAGGLSRTFEYEGFVFDIGPHRFHTSDDEVHKYILDILGSEYIKIQRYSSVFLAGRNHQWPLNLASVLKLPPRMLLPSLRDLFRKAERNEINSFADYIISKYGKNLFEQFFRGYTRKFAGIEPGKLHHDWARAGVDRAVIDKRVSADSLISLIRSVLIPKPVNTMFIYPATGGISTFTDRQLTRICNTGGILLAGAEAVGVEEYRNRVRGVRLSNGKIIEANRVFWSAPVSILFPDTGFKYIHTVIFNVGLQNRQNNHWQWCYYGDSDISFSRLTAPVNFRTDTVPMAADSLIAEITCNSGDEVWKNPKLFIPEVLDDLEKVKAARAADVLFVKTEKIRETYPIYDLEYRNHVINVEKQLPEGLVLLGRSGSFWYNNMDHSIAQALNYASGSMDYKRNFWER